MRISPWVLALGVAAILSLGGVTVAESAAFDAVVYRLADAIAFAEGFYAGESRPKRNNNPGDLTLPEGFPSVGYDGIYVIFKTLEDGWNALKHQVGLMLSNQSTIYNRDMSIAEVAEHYTTTQQNEWAQNVASRLGVSVDTRLSEL